MNINMNDSHIESIAQIKEFLKIDSIRFESTSPKKKCAWIDNDLTKFRCFSLRKKIDL